MATPTLTGSSHLGVTDNQKRWLVAGIALNKILIPRIRPFTEQGVNTEYSNLKTSHNIHAQSTSGRLQKWPPGKFLKYENINGNDVHPRLPGKRFNYSLFDCRVTSHVDFARLYVENHMAKFTAFDEHCDASSVLLLLGRVPAFNMAVQTAADVVRTVRNDWAHCVFSKWDQPKFLKSFSEMEQLVRSMTLPTADEAELLGELKDWESKGTHLCMNSPVDPALLQLVHQELKSLHDVLDNMSVESVEEKTKVRCELGSISAGLEEVKQRVQRLETGQKNLENCAKLAQSRMNDFQGHIHKKMKMLENNQQDTERRSALVEDRVNVVEDSVDHLQGYVHKKMKMLENNQQGTESRTALVEDRVNVVEGSVHHLQGHVHKKMKMLENNQQGTESRTVLVEDRVNVVEDRVNVVDVRVNVVEDSVQHLQDTSQDFDPDAFLQSLSELKQEELPYRNLSPPHTPIPHVCPLHPQEVLDKREADTHWENWESSVPKGVREIIDKHMPDTTPKERLYQEKRGLGPYEGNWHPEEPKQFPHMKKLYEQDIQEMVRKELEWHLYK